MSQRVNIIKVDRAGAIDNKDIYRVFFEIGSVVREITIFAKDELDAYTVFNKEWYGKRTKT